MISSSSSDSDSDVEMEDVEILHPSNLAFNEKDYDLSTNDDSDIEMEEVDQKKSTKNSKQQLKLDIISIYFKLIL